MKSDTSKDKKIFERDEGLFKNILISFSVIQDTNYNFICIFASKLKDT